MLSTVFYDAPNWEQEFLYASVVSFSNSAKRRAKEPLNINGICKNKKSRHMRQAATAPRSSKGTINCHPTPSECRCYPRVFVTGSPTTLPCLFSRKPVCRTDQSVRESRPFQILKANAHVCRVSACQLRLAKHLHNAPGCWSLTCGEP